ncbi:Mov34/MPN/PAD-1 family protein [Piscibacillus sp. B03]|uniref:Mov34/MPN/PAD-1 family protein n=1 Tax=Piscibacillus sp. B03 TaxID=3457430 RepID=UPI003FCC78BC
MSQDVFSLFNITEESEEKRQEEVKQQDNQPKGKEEPKKSKQTNATNNQSSKTNQSKNKDENTFDIKPNTKFYHLGEEIDITEYLSEDEIKNGIMRKKKGEEVLEPVTGEDLRKRVEKDFPDLVKSYTELVYLKKKNLVVAVSKAKKKGLYSDCPSGQSSPLPKIPFSIVVEFCRFAFDVYKEKGTECHADIYYDYDEQDYFLDIPQQIASVVNVEVSEDAVSMAVRLSERRHRKIMEIHSHHNMSPTPSSTDNQSETGSFLYAIVGNINDYFPDITLRYYDRDNHRHVGVDLHQVFENPFKQSSTFDTSLVEEVDVV